MTTPMRASLNDISDLQIQVKRFDSSASSDMPVNQASTVCSESYQERISDIKEIYNEDMSPTIVCVAYDTIFEKKIVVKKILKNMLDEHQLHQARTECALTCISNHFNLCTGYEHFENEEELAIIMEYVGEAEYFLEKIENTHKPIKNELKMKSYVLDILQGLHQLHSQGYVHLDIKLANLFCSSKEEEGVRRVKVGDFGLCHKIDKSTGLAYVKNSCGTLGYKPPEVKSNSYVSPKADMWSLGIVLYQMACAYKPHQIKGYKYSTGPIPFRHFDWKKRSQELKAFIERLLSLNPDHRPTAEEAMRDPWFQTTD